MASIIDSCNDNIRRIGLYEELPQELWIEIFVRASVESLLRLKCLCTHWHALISNPSFIKKHLEFQKITSKNMGSFLLQHYQNGTNLSSYLLFDEASVASVATSSSSHGYHVQYSLDNTCMGRHTCIEGPVNGLYCVYGGTDRIVIWNPATNEVGFLPLSGECLPDKTCSYESDHDPSCIYIGLGKIGFGTDPLNEEDYKVVMICLAYQVDELSTGDYYRLLYTASTNTWRILEDVDNFVGSGDPYKYFSNNTYLNGFYYWLVLDNGKADVLAFDMGKNEVFRKISTPNFGSENIGYRRDLAVHNDHINLIIMNKALSEIDVWELIVEESVWMNKKSVVIGIHGVQKTLGFGEKDGDMFFVIDDLGERCNGQTILYNITNREIKNIGPRGCVTYFKTFVYYESLVSLGREIKKYKGNHTSSLETIWCFLSGDTIEDSCQQLEKLKL